MSVLQLFFQMKPNFRYGRVVFGNFRKVQEMVKNQKIDFFEGDNFFVENLCEWPLKQLSFPLPGIYIETTNIRFKRFFLRKVKKIHKSVKIKYLTNPRAINLCKNGPQPLMQGAFYIVPFNETKNSNLRGIVFEKI